MESKLQKLAQQAKQRIRSGFWKDENNVISNRVMESAESDNQALYEAVVDIVNSDVVVTNPLARVMDRDYYQTLDEGQKERYIMNLSKEYVRVSREYTKVMQERYFRKVS